MDLYTPTKDLDGAFIPIVGTPQTPDVYIPTKITASTSSFTTPQSTSKPEEGTTRQKYGGTETYSPSVPGIRIVKRKPKEAEPSTSTTTPKKGILRMPGQKRPTRRIFFADTRGLPLCAVKEIERLTSIQNHSKFADFRTFEKNEACIGWKKPEMDWNVVAVKTARPLKDVESESTIREKMRLEGLPLPVRMNMIPICPDLQDNPELTELAQADFQASKPINIPPKSRTPEKHTLQTLRDLPLPGRKRPMEAESSNQVNHYAQVNTYAQNTYEQVYTNNTATVYQASMAATSKPAEIQQIFQESDQIPQNNYYTSAPSVEEPQPKSALPASLNLLLSQLKQKGLVSSEDTPPTTTTPLASAMQAAQQMMQNQQAPVVNTYSQETTGQEFVNGYEGYVAEFVTPEMSAQELRQDSRHNEGGWGQNGFKINEPCAYFVNRRDGCNRGDQCRFIHDEELRHQKQSEMYNRREHRHDVGFRGNRRGNFRGGFIRNNHHDREYRGGNYNDNNRFGGQGGYRRGFDQPPAHREDSGPPPGTMNPMNPSQMDQQDLDAAAYAQMYGQAAAKKRRVSRFDQRDGVGEGARDVDQRQPRRNRFDEGPATGRQFRSRFDEKPRDQDERNPGYMGQRSF